MKTVDSILRALYKSNTYYEKDLKQAKQDIREWILRFKRKLPFCPDYPNTYFDNKEKKYTERDMRDANRTMYFLNREKILEHLAKGIK